MSTPSRGTIVLLDDSEIVLGAAKATLEAHGFDVRATANLEQLERELAGTRPVLFVLDVQMPEMFGDDVAQVLREVRKMNVPIVLFSDIDDAELAQRGGDAGVQACVPKRAGLRELVTRIEALLEPS
jgi:DNA-binding response OmpR family regulator